MEHSQHERVVVLDFGGQYAQLIARRVRDLGVYCEIKNYKTDPEALRDCKGIIFTGGPNSVYAEGAPLCSKAVFDLGVPVLGICYGACRPTAHLLGGRRERAEHGPRVSAACASRWPVPNSSPAARGGRRTVAVLDEPHTTT